MRLERGGARRSSRVCIEWSMNEQGNVEQDIMEPWRVCDDMVRQKKACIVCRTICETDTAR